MSKIFTGIGSRETPKIIGEVQTAVASDLAMDGFILRSGKAKGSDQNFQNGYELIRHEKIRCKAEIYLPTPRFEAGFGHRAWNIFVKDDQLLKRAMNIVKTIHPDWASCDAFARSAHTRNVFQVMGLDLRTYSKFVLFYAPEIDGVVHGGTATAVNLARKLKIPTFNFYRNKASNLRAFLKEHAK